MDEIKKLILNVQNGKTSDFDVLHAKYEGLIKSMSKKYSDMCSFQINVNEDFTQEGKEAFYKAILTYDVNRQDVTFGAYSKICIRNRLISCVRSANSKKRQKGEMEPEIPTGPQDKLILREKGKEIMSLAEKILSDYEKIIFSYYWSGKKPREIGKLVGKEVKSVNNALCRIKAKLKRMLNNDT